MSEGATTGGGAPRRIAVLLTSNDRAAFAQRFPDDGAKFRALLAPLAPQWQFETVAVKDNVFPAHCRDYDGYIISGSPASVKDRDPWIARLMLFIQELHRERLPTVGVCFGHQAIAQALGGEVLRNADGWQLGVATTAFERFAPWQRPQLPSLALYAAHNEQVGRLPAGAECLGSGPGCKAASFSIGRHFFTTEYHPEMSLEFMQALTDHLAPHLGPELAQRARTQLQQDVQGAQFGQWMLRFLGGA
jgi:GMP synthase-like glutamine amidotransferase